MTGVTELVAMARAGIENLRPAEVAAELDAGGALLVDVRDPDEAGAGTIDGALVVSRGRLEFYADPAHREHLPELTGRRRLILYSNTGARSALAARSLQDLGYRDVAHLEGGIAAWLADGRALRVRRD